MAAVANNPSFAKKAGVPQSVGKEFSNADKGRKFKEGGDMKDEMKKGKMPAALAKHAGMPASKAHKGLKAGGMAKGGGIEAKGKTKGTMVKMTRGGKTC
jgi:hypothetical protein